MTLYNYGRRVLIDRRPTPDGSPGPASPPEKEPLMSKRQASEYEVFAKAQQADRARNADRDAVCPTCMRQAWNPWREYDGERRIVFGCVDRIHEQFVVNGSLAWHRAFWKPRQIRKAA